MNSLKLSISEFGTLEESTISEAKNSYVEKRSRHEDMKMVKKLDRIISDNYQTKKIDMKMINFKGE